MILVVITLQDVAAFYRSDLMLSTSLIIQIYILEVEYYSTLNYIKFWVIFENVGDNGIAYSINLKVQRSEHSFEANGVVGFVYCSVQISRIICYGEIQSMWLNI